MGEDGLFLGKVVGSSQMLFPVSSLPASSSISASQFFPSFASAPSVVVPNPENAELQNEFTLRQDFDSRFWGVDLAQTSSSGQRADDYPTDGVNLTENGAERSEEWEQVARPASDSLGSVVPPAELEERDSSVKRKRRKEKQRKRKREEEEAARIAKKDKKNTKLDADAKKIGVLDSSIEGRKSTAIPWADGNANSRKEYYLDTRGDRDNLAFGSLYKMDVARYHREDLGEFFKPNAGKYLTRRIRLFENDRDGVLQDEVARTPGRYWSLRITSAVRKRNLKYLRGKNNEVEHNPNDCKLSQLGDFVPLEIGGHIINKVESLQTDITEEGETWQEYVARKTKELNILTRERPNEESLWIRFADFQDELIDGTTKKSVIQLLVEKKVAILEKALSIHKDSEDLLILYLETCLRCDSADILLSKWEHAVHCHSGSLRMWQEFLRFRLSQFSSFSVSSIRTVYNRGLYHLAAARNRMYLKSVTKDDNSEDLVEGELALVSMFVNLCTFNWQAGHHELAVGLFQAGIEYGVFAPRNELNESEKQNLFENFWRSGAHRFGEDGASGWVTWLETEERHQQVLRDREIQLALEAQLEEEAGGWTGWSAPAPTKELADFDNDPRLVDNGYLDIEGGAEVDDGSLQMDEDEPSLMDEDDAALQEILGLSLDSSKEVEVKDTLTWKRWSEKEVQRDQEQWLPLNSQTDVEGDELERMVLFEDIKDSLFTLYTKQAQLSLIHHLIDFCDGHLSQWCCTNNKSYIWKLKSLESLKGTILAGTLKSAKSLENGSENSIVELVKSPSWYQESSGRAKFVRNCASIGRSKFPQERLLLDALLNAEDLANEDRKSQSLKMLPSQALCKKLLKVHRKDLLIWGAYACSEAAAGNVAAARKVFDTALASLGPLSPITVPDVPILCLAYAEVEIAHLSGKSDRSAGKRALRVLCCLGAGSVYTPHPTSDDLPATLLLKGHRGFQDLLHRVRTNEGRNLSERGAAVIVCAGMFENLMNGWEAATAVFEEGLAMSLPGKRQLNLECELLAERYVGMLHQSKTVVKPSRSWYSMSRWFREYPCNVALIGACIRSASQFGQGYKLRRFLDDATARVASPILWLLSLSCEMRRPGSGPRIHRLFERALEGRETKQSVLLWRCYLAYEVYISKNLDAARRVYFRAIHACPWSKKLWVDGFSMLSSIISAKELSDFVDVMRDKGLHLRTDVYEILLEYEDAGIS